MKKEIKIVDEARGICRVTTVDERWYTKESVDPATGLPTIEFRPSVTYICKFYPKGKALEVWQKKHGEESDILMQLAGERGSKVHQAVEMLNKGAIVHIDSQFVNTTTGKLEELTPDEYGCVVNYKDWWINEGSKQYEILGVEEVVFPEGVVWAGTLDLRVRRLSDNTHGVIDLKTSKAVHSTHIIQVSALVHGTNADWGAVLQVGYTPNKSGYKFTMIPLRYDLFLAAQTIWEFESGGDTPLQREYPLIIQLAKSAEPKKSYPQKKKQLAEERGKIDIGLRKGRKPNKKLK